jgi:hypothetical protein
MDTYKRYGQFQKGLFTHLTDGAIKQDFTKPVNKSQAEEAKNVNLTLVSRSSDPNYNYYTHDTCGHSAFYQPTHVRRNNTMCKACLLLVHAKEASTKGFALLHHVSASRKLYIRPCGHISEMSTQNIRESKVKRCSECFEEKLHSFSDKNGYVYESSGTDLVGYFRDIRFKKCGHIKRVHHSQIIKGNVVCRVCADENNYNAAAAHGLIEVKDIGDRYKEYILPCGHKKTLRIDHAISDSYSCEVCGDSHYTKPSNLYLFKFSQDGFQWLKFGFAKDISNRKSNYGVSAKADAVLLVEIPMPRGIDAVRTEKKIHGEMKKYRFSKEIMKDYHRHNGFTECYSLDALEEFLERLSKIQK